MFGDSVRMRANRNNVEKYVQARLRNCVDEKERNRHGYRIAKMYAEIGEYDLARKYVSGYLSETPSAAQAHKLLASCLENLGKRSQALTSYQTSFEFEPDQKEILLKICELMCADDVPLDPQRAEYWIERTRKHFPNDPILFDLRERLIVENGGDGGGGGGGGGPDDVERLIVSELERKPTYTALRVRLLRHLLHANKLTSAYRHARDVEKLGSDVFDDDVDWYETVAHVLTRYVRESAPPESPDVDFWTFAVSVHDRLTALTLADRSGAATSACAARLIEFDAAIACAVAKAGPAASPVDRNVLAEFTRHYGAQLCLHAATFLLKKAKCVKLTYREVKNVTVPLLVLATAAAPPDTHAPWLTDCAEHARKRIARWRIDASYRCSQAGRVLWSLLDGSKANFADRLAQMCGGDWRRRAFEKIFPDRPASTFATGYFCKCPEFAEPRPVVPTRLELVRYDRDAQLRSVKSLHDTVWIALDSDLAELRLTAFPGLQLSTANLSNCAAETLNALDVRSFVYAATMCAEARRSERRAAPYRDDKPPVLPASITDPLCTPAQQEWYDAVYKVYANRCGSDFGGVRVTLTRGIEALRCVGNHGMSVALLVRLARTFAAYAKSRESDDETRAADERAALYWNNAVPLLERLHAGRAVKYATGKQKMFEYVGAGEMQRHEIETCLEDGKVYLALRLRDAREYDKALELLSDLRGPYASYHSAEIYETLADESVGHDSETLTSEMRSRHVIMLSKARSCVYATLDRLRAPSAAGGRDHPLDAVLGQKIEEIESRLGRYDADNAEDQYGFHSRGVSNASSPDSVQENTPSRQQHVSRYLFANSDVAKNKSPKCYVQSTPYRGGVDVAHDSSERRTEARPSPERLDAQLRRITTMFYGLEQKIDRLAARIDERFARVEDDTKDIAEIKRTMHDLKATIVDNNTQVKQNVSDLCKELESKLKSTTQLNDEDLYVLDDDYDYGATIANAQCAYGQNALYPRPAPAAPLAYHTPSLYPTIYAGMYGYAGLPMSAFAEPPDFRAVGQPQALTPRAQTQGLAQVVQPNLLQSAQLVAQTTPQALQRPLPLLSAQPTYAPTAPVAQQTAVAPGAKPAPVNVVITASDPVPSATATTIKPPILSVMIPPQHLKINAPRTQIAAAATTMTTASPAAVSSAQPPSRTPTRVREPFVPKSPPSGDDGLGAEATATPPVAATAHNFQIPLPPNSGLFVFSQAFEQSKSTPETADSPVREGADTLEDEHDPCPDFKPIVPLPDEVEVKTGEESEVVLYKERAKLYRYVEKEWRERGVGDLKLLKNAVTGKVRLLMRRDQVHKICANHFLSADMELQPMTSSNRAFVWAANDYADEEVRVEKLCVRFKTSEQADRFKKHFDEAKSSASSAKFGQGPAEARRAVEKPAEKPPQPQPIQKLAEKPNPLAAFSFAPSKFVAERPDESKRADASPHSPTPLPDLVDVKTLGGEDEKTAFGARAKLSTFDAACDRWSERGVGSLTVLVSGIVRLHMHADGAGFGVRAPRVLCNHRVTKTMEFARASTDDTVRWTAHDYSETEMKRESFEAEFVNAGDARRFVEAVTAVQGRMDAGGFVDDAKAAAGKAPEKKEPANVGETAPATWGQLFRPKVGSWECKSCYIRNEANDDACCACATPRDGAAAAKNEKAPAAASGWGDLFKPKPGSWKCKSCYVTNEPGADRCVACETAKDPTKKTLEPKGIAVPDADASKFTFGIPSAGQQKFTFGTAEPKFSFGAKADAPSDATARKYDFGVPPVPKEAPPATASEAPAGDAQKFNFGAPTSAFVSKASWFTFGSAASAVEPATGGYTFGQKDASGSPAKYEFAFTPRASRRSTDNADESDGGENNASEDDGEHIHFSPVVPLPEKIDVKTGEENEDVLYCHRAKLFRYVDGEWKERGVGNIKILRDRDTGRVRALMRRDQVLKLCLNHVLTPDVEYRVKDERSWIFCASDYSDGDLKRELFCVRFKFKRAATEFKEAVDAARGGREVAPRAPSAAAEEIEILYEVEVDPEQKRLAETLLLPPNFFAYEKCEPCPGCIGCDSENYEFAGPRPAAAAEEDERPTAERTDPDDEGTNGGDDAVAVQRKENDASDDRSGGAATTTTGSFTFGPSSDVGVFSKIHANHDLKVTYSFGQRNVEATPKTDAAKTTPAAVSFGDTTAFGPSVSIFPVEKKADVTKATAVQKNPFSGFSTQGYVFGQQESGGDVAAKHVPGETAADGGGGGIALNLPDFGVDFASLAAKSSSTLAFSNPNPDSMFSNAGAPVFARLAKKSAAVTAEPRPDADETPADRADDAEYDPHYEPIVPLPDEIEIRTGEENESVEFSSRAKLFRYDGASKEWKERGVGDVKLLKGVGTWRLLMRRDQIHKVVLNERVRAEGPKLAPLDCSPKAFCWTAQNYADETSGSPSVERLAVRFGNTDAAKSFADALDDARSRVAEALERTRTDVAWPTAEAAAHDRDAENPGSTDDDSDDRDDDDDVDYEDYDDDDDRATVFTRRCTYSARPSGGGEWVDVGTGDASVCYDDESFGSKIYVEADDGYVMASCTIGTNTTMRVDGAECTWTAVDRAAATPVRKDMRVRFADADSAEQFHAAFLEGMQCAQATGVEDALPAENET